MDNNQIEELYNNLLHEVENNDFYKTDLTNRVNCYTCECGHITKTKDVDSGVTPFLHSCENCNKMAKSTFYKDIVPDRPHTQEWYRPSLQEIFDRDLFRNKPFLLDHILNGGLDIRMKK
jgi:hypothetical protein